MVNWLLAKASGAAGGWAKSAISMDLNSSAIWTGQAPARERVSPGASGQLIMRLAEHALYGRVLILTKNTAKWAVAELDALNRPHVAGPFRIADAARY